MFGIFKKYSVSILNREWKVLENVLRIKHIPRSGEVLFYRGEYYRVINIVHYLNRKQGIFIIVDKLDGKPD